MVFGYWITTVCTCLLSPKLSLSSADYSWKYSSHSLRAACLQFANYANYAETFCSLRLSAHRILESYIGLIDRIELVVDAKGKGALESSGTNYAEFLVQPGTVGGKHRWSSTSMLDLSSATLDGGLHMLKASHLRLSA